MTRILVARAPTWWRRVPLIVLAVVAHLVLGLLVALLRVIRVIFNLAATAVTRAEQQLSARTGRPALSQTYIGALAAAFAHEFLASYHQPTTR